MFRRPKILSLLLLLTLSACASGLPRPTGDPYIPSDAIQVIASNPYFNFNDIHSDSATDVPLDQSIAVVFSRKIDSYSTLVPENFALFSKYGEIVRGHLSHLYVEDPYDSSQMTSMVIFDPIEHLSKETQYTFLWRGVPQDTAFDEIPTELAGIRGIDGALIVNGSFDFKTGTSYTDFQRDSIEVLGMSPGRIIRGRDDLGLSLGDLFNDHVTINGNAPIRITLSEPFLDDYRIDDPAQHIDPTQDPIPEIPPTPIEDFLPMKIGIINSASETAGALIDSISELDDNEWINFQDEAYRKLRGKVHTEYGRTVLVFELETNCNNPENCRYPANEDSLVETEVVVVLLRGLRGIHSKRLLPDDPTVGGFVHVSGFELPIGFSPTKPILDLLNIEISGGVLTMDPSGGNGS